MFIRSSVVLFILVSCMLLGLCAYIMMLFSVFVFSVLVGGNNPRICGFALIVYGALGLGWVRMVLGDDILYMAFLAVAVIVGLSAIVKGKKWTKTTIHDTYIPFLIMLLVFGSLLLINTVALMVLVLIALFFVSFSVSIYIAVRSVGPEKSSS